MTIDRTNLKEHLTTPAAALCVALSIAVVAALLPGRWVTPIRAAAMSVLRPGQIAATGLRHGAKRVSTAVRSHFRTAARLAEAEAEIERLEREHRRIAAQLVAARSQMSDVSERGEDQLLQVDCVEARVLGSQARAYLARRRLLSAGSRDGVQPNAWVIDRGADAEIESGRLVVSGRCVWGKIVEIGPYTSTVQCVSEPGYRDLVQIAGGPRGILEGTGESLCRIRLVEVTEPVSVGDAVTTTTGRGALPGGLLYGEVVRLERPMGAAHWEIWMRPAVGADEPRRVGVLRIELNPVRVAGKKGVGTGG